MNLQYPIGEFKYNGRNTREQQISLINQIDEAPQQLYRVSGAFHQSNSILRIAPKDGPFVRLFITWRTAILTVTYDLNGR